MTTPDDKAGALLAANAVRIIHRSGTLISARIRDRAGIYDVQLALDSGTARADCTCRPPKSTRGDECAHIEAVVRVTIQPLELEEPVPPAESPQGWPRDYDFRPHADAHGIIEAPTPLLWLGFQDDLKRIDELREVRGEAAPEESLELMRAAVAGLCGGRPAPGEIARLPEQLQMLWLGQMIGAATALHLVPTAEGESDAL